MISVKALAMVGAVIASTGGSAYLSLENAPKEPLFAGWHCENPKDLHALMRAQHDLTGQAFWDKRQELTSCGQQGVIVYSAQPIGYDVIGKKRYAIYRIVGQGIYNDQNRVWFTAELRDHD